MIASFALNIRARFGIAGLRAKKSLSLSAGVLPSSVKALSPRSLIQSGSPTGATVASPSSAPRSTITRKRGSRPSARAALGRCAQANSTPDASSSWRRDGAWRPGIASPPLELRRHQQERQRLGPALGARDGLARFRRCERAEREIDRTFRIDQRRHAPRELIGDVEALGEPVPPG